MNDVKIMYRTKRYSPTEIEKIEITGKTEKTVTYIYDWWGKKTQNRQLLETSNIKWHDTWEEAREYLLEQAGNKIEHAENVIEKQHAIIEKLIKMKEDERIKRF